MLLLHGGGSGVSLSDSSDQSTSDGHGCSEWVLLESIGETLWVLKSHLSNVEGTLGKSVSDRLIGVFLEVISKGSVTDGNTDSSDTLDALGGGIPVEVKVLQLGFWNNNGVHLVFLFLNYNITWL